MFLDFLNKIFSFMKGVPKSDPKDSPKPIVTIVPQPGVYKETSMQPMKRGSTGPDVLELQIRLSGFRGTIWDGSFGPGVELQVIQFQKDFMKMPNPTGIIDQNFLNSLKDFSSMFPIDFNSLKCTCGQCPGFGNGQNKGVYNGAKIEMNNQYEYPGIHKAILWAYRATCFYNPQYKFQINCGYRCSFDNQKNNRTSTNHFGKALDVDTLDVTSKQDDMDRCSIIRGKMVEVGNFQIGWEATNRKSFEPKEIAPTWVHMDVRQFEGKYLDDKFFVKESSDLEKI